MKTAIQALTEELTHIQAAKSECEQDGRILNGYKYRYQLLTRKAREIRESLEYLKQL